MYIHLIAYIQHHVNLFSVCVINFFVCILFSYFSSTQRLKELIGAQTGLDPNHMELYYENLPYHKKDHRAAQLPNTTVRERGRDGEREREREREGGREGGREREKFPSVPHSSMYPPLPQPNNPITVFGGPPQSGASLRIPAQRE